MGTKELPAVRKPGRKPEPKHRPKLPDPFEEHPYTTIKDGVRARFERLSPEAQVDFLALPPARREAIESTWLSEMIYPRLEWERIKRKGGPRVENAISLMENLRDPSFLPTLDEVRSALLPGSQWENFCRAHDSQLYEIFNQEYVHALASYLVERAREYGATAEKPMIVLEVGAGEGKLTHFLAQECDRLSPGLVNIIANSSVPSKWGGLTQPRYPVELGDYADALEQHDSDMVICSWMPNGIDWSANFRATSSVKEYVLIGEADHGCCGHYEKTWGCDGFTGEPLDEMPYQADGFSRYDLGALSQLQVCRYDSFYESLGFVLRSETVSFRRE